LRFDFAHNKALSQDELDSIEELVNAQILRNSPVQKKVMAIDAARKLGAMALFGEKYGDEVRVISMGNSILSGKDEVFSVELCGGTHVERTGDIGIFMIIRESGIAAGVRRIEATTGKNALARFKDMEKNLQAIAAVLKTSTDGLAGKVQLVVNANKILEKDKQQMKIKSAATATGDLVERAQNIKGIKVLVAEVDGIDSKSLRDTADQLRNKLGSGVVVLALKEVAKVSLVVAVSKDLTDRIKAGDLVNNIAEQVGGKGGGRADLAMAGGTRPEGLEQALASVNAYITRLI